MLAAAGHALPYAREAAGGIAPAGTPRTVQVARWCCPTARSAEAVERGAHPTSTRSTRRWSSPSSIDLTRAVAASACSATTATLHRRASAPMTGPDRARRDADDEPFILHPGEFVLGARWSACALPRPRRAARGQELARPPRPAHPLDGRLHRPGLRRAHHARAVERRQPADHALPRHEDRPDLLPADDHRRRLGLRQRRARLEVPGPDRPTPSRYWKNFVDQ